MDELTDIVKNSKGARAKMVIVYIDDDYKHAYCSSCETKLEEPCYTQEQCPSCNAWFRGVREDYYITRK